MWQKKAVLFLQFVLVKQSDIKDMARQAYIDKVLSFVNLSKLKPLKIIINSGNGAAGPTIDALNCKLKENGIETNFSYLYHEPDPKFPNGIPNPITGNK